MVDSCCSYGDAYDDVKLANNIKFHLGLSGNTSFDMLPEESRESIGDRLKLILRMVASGALLSLMSSILSGSDIRKSAVLSGIVAHGSVIDSNSHTSGEGTEELNSSEERLEDMLTTEGSETTNSDSKESDTELELVLQDDKILAEPLLRAKPQEIEVRTKSTVNSKETTNPANHELFSEGARLNGENLGIHQVGAELALDPSTLHTESLRKESSDSNTFVTYYLSGTSDFSSTDESMEASASTEKQEVLNLDVRREFEKAFTEGGFSDSRNVNTHSLLRDREVDVDLETGKIITVPLRSMSRDELPMTPESSELDENHAENQELFNFDMKYDPLKMPCSQQPPPEINESNEFDGSSSTFHPTNLIANGGNSDAQKSPNSPHMSPQKSPNSSVEFTCKTLILKSLWELGDKAVHFQKLTHHMASRHGFQMFANNKLIKTSLRELQEKGTVIKSGIGYYQVVRNASSNTFSRVEKCKLSENRKVGGTPCDQRPADKLKEGLKVLQKVGFADPQSIKCEMSNEGDSASESDQEVTFKAVPKIIPEVIPEIIAEVISEVIPEEEATESKGREVNSDKEKTNSAEAEHVGPEAENHVEIRINNVISLNSQEEYKDGTSSSNDAMERDDDILVTLEDTPGSTFMAQKKIVKPPKSPRPEKVSGEEKKIILQFFHNDIRGKKFINKKLARFYIKQTKSELDCEQVQIAVNKKIVSIKIKENKQKISEQQKSDPGQGSKSQDQQGQYQDQQDQDQQGQDQGSLSLMNQKLTSEPVVKLRRLSNRQIAKTTRERAKTTRKRAKTTRETWTTWVGSAAPEGWRARQCMGIAGSFWRCDLCKFWHHHKGGMSRHLEKEHPD